MAQDVFSKMAEDPCVLNEDGYLNVDTDVKEIIYHPSLNVILICTNSGIVRVLDLNSGVVIHSSNLTALNPNEVTCRYIPGQGRILFSDGQAIGVRSAYNGVLLLDSILQKPISNTKDEIKLELPLSEAIILKQSLAIVPGNEHIINELTNAILDAQKHSKLGIKAQKWNTICIQYSLEDLRSAARSSVSELILKNQHTPELGVASAVQERLSELCNEPVTLTDKRCMASEAKRRETFSQWPHMDYKWALPDQMAQAGFYHQPNASGDDRAMCFTCTVCLVCWERTDEPWSEHERHSPTCPFVMGEYTQNVPLSVTYATNPAIDATYRGVNVRILGTSSAPNLLPTSNNDGLISVFDISGKIKRTHSFFVTQFDSHILERFTLDFGVPGTWTDADEVKYPAEKNITALSIVSEKQKIEENGTPAPQTIRPTIICGLNIRNRPNKFQEQQILSITKDEESSTSSNCISCLYLVVYDFMYTKEQETDSDSKIVQENTENEDGIVTSEENQKNAKFIVPCITDTLGSDISDSQILSKLSSLYKTLIPGESDEVFLPPPMPPTKPHSGPRVLPVDMQNTETDSSQVLTFPLCAEDYSFMNGHLPTILTETFEKTISDHITDLKTNKTGKKLNYSRAVQCICIPEQYKNRKDLEISYISTTQDGCHVLVVLRNLYDSISVLLLYPLDFSSKMVQLKSDACLVRELNSSEKPLEVSLLLPLDKVGGDSTEHDCKSEAEGNIVLVCSDGAVRIVDLCNLQTICFAKIDGDKFVSAAYCNSLERLCASTEKGSLHFYALNDTDNESSEDHEDDDIFGINIDCPSVSTSQPTDTLDGCEITRYFHEPPEQITATDLKRLYALTNFEPLKAGYCAVVPPCWSEIQQAQRQRRHPQSIKDCDQYTKTWRLQTDTTTWDEHLFEITLPTPMALGHVDVNFTLQSSMSLPHVEVTLLRQIASGIGHKRDVKFSVDESVTIDMLHWADNPVISQEYLRAHNAEILAGPINIASCLDLTDQSGTVTLTSPKLFKSRNRTLLLHIRAVYTKDDLNNKNSNKGKKSEKISSVTSVVDKLAQGSTRKIEFYMGCDCIHELSVTVYTSKHTDLPHERTLRNLMLESNIFIQSLLLSASSNSSNEIQCLVLDVLNWVSAIRLTRNRSNNGEPPYSQLEFLHLIESNMTSLIHDCLIHGGRSITHKLMKLIITCCSGAKNVCDASGTYFNTCVLNSLLSSLNNIYEIKSAGGLQWYFTLLLKVTSKDKSDLVVNRCVTLLTKISDELQRRSNPYHLLLRSRYGLYGSPMEPELFDIDPPPSPKGTGTSMTYFSLLPGYIPTTSNDFFTNFSFNKEGINPKDVMSTSNDAKLKFRNIAPNKMLKGLIETEPLHFTCVSASEGTRIERADNLLNNTFSGVLPPFSISSTSGGLASNLASNNNNNTANVAVVATNKKDDVQKYLSEVCVNLMENQVKKAVDEVIGTSDVKPKPFCVYFGPEDVANSLPVTEAFLESMQANKEELKTFWDVDMIQGHSQTHLQPSKLYWQTEDILSPPNQPSSLCWQHLLVPPPQQVIVVERMHSGARRFITIDFGQPVLLTDILMPSCNDIVIITIDIWMKSEDVDGTRLVVVSDIGSKNLLLNDLQPPPICRYVKITTVGRYGMSTTRCRIPVPYFYGHIVILPEDVPQDFVQNFTNLTTSELEKQRSFLSKLFEDISCRYSLACSKLKELLQPYYVADLKNASHLSIYMSVLRDRANSSNNNIEHSKVFNAYQEAVTYQRQLNTIKNIISRIEGSSSPSSHQQNQKDLPSTSTDKLRSIAEGLLDVLLTIDIVIEIGSDVCSKLFQGLCVSQASRLQFLAATFLDKLCGRKKYWGNFIADTLMEMFATNYTSKFPQDRVFILLAYLGRRSSERSAVIDAALRVVSQTLTPLLDTRKSLLAVSVDLPLLSWLLMYISLQLDLSREDQNCSRWDWVFGEMVGKTNIECAKAGRKKPYKRLNGPTEICGTSQHAYQCFMSSIPQANLTTKLNAALKAQEFLMKKVKYKSLKEAKNSATENILNTKKLREYIEPLCEKPSSTTKCIPQHIDSAHCLAVAKGLLCLVLSMDHSSSADMLLLSFKVMARLVVIAKFRLGQLMSQEQLLKLVNFCMASKIPWAPHALACLLQDVIEISHPLLEEVEMDTETSASTSWATNDLISDVESLCESFTHSEALMVEPIFTTGETGNKNTNQLPSVYETDDSELEELMIEDFNKSTPKKSLKITSHSSSGTSAAVDSRLEIGVEALIEISLRKLVYHNNQMLIQNISNNVVVPESDEPLTAWPSQFLPYQPETTLSNHKMLTTCFESLFENLPLETNVNIEHILQLWLTLNCTNKEMKFDPSSAPQIVLKSESIKCLISAMAWTPGLSLCTWTISLQALTLFCNSYVGSGTSAQWADISGIAHCIVSHPDFIQFFLRLLSGSGLLHADKGLAGPTLCKALHDFLVRLLMRCDVVSPSSKLGSLLKTSLLKIVYQLVQPSGPIATQQGCMDAQCKLLQSIYYLDFSNADLSIAMSILESTGVLVQSYIVNVDRVKCINIGEKSNVIGNNFSDIFASVLCSEANKQDRPVSNDVLLIALLKLLGKLVQTPIPNDNDRPEAMDTEQAVPTSQTDESKAEQIQQDTVKPPQQVPCLADIVLQHHPSIIRLCHCLAACKSSSLCMLANVSQKAAFSNLSEPNTVGDAVFQVLASLAKKTSKKELLLSPLLMFLSQAPQLSEPLLWFILQVLDTEEAIKGFLNAGGINILGKSFVTSNNAPNTISKMGTISTVMQHFSGLNPVSDANTAIAASSAPKKSQQAHFENKLSLLNFAPCCTIKCLSGTAQPADVLIQGGAATHRRARTPQWSYHFYPEETHTDLLIQLPSAVLLREVHLQPHLSQLATCPSSVALEISSNGSSRLIPVSPPLPTSGMTFIRLHLPVPEVVNCILLRLYKPRDANNIGLSQIRVLGHSAFGGSITQSFNDNGEDESHCRHSLGWLRLLHHCFTLPSDPELLKQIITCASQVTQLLTTCCGLLLVPSHVLPVYLPCLEKVLRELSLYDLENSITAIKVLLESRSSIIEPSFSQENTWQDRLLINATGYQSACELLYQICEYQDQDTSFRVSLILEWLQNVTHEAVSTGCMETCNPAYISSIASILWTANQTQINYDLKSMITIDFFDSIYNLKLNISNNKALKYALDSLLCSLCYIKPEFYPMLLQKINILIPISSIDHHAASISDDRKDSECMTDDNKESFQQQQSSEWFNNLVVGQLQNLVLSNEQLETVALVSRSPTSIQQLLDSGLPKVLNSAIMEFCTSEEDTAIPMAKLENVTSILKFFTDVSDERSMRDWLGSSDGSVFWVYLLHWLCRKPCRRKSSLQSEARAQLEEVCVKFLSKCCLCHPNNQGRLAKVLCNVIALQSNGISGFMRRLILQLLLENEKIPVSITANETLYKNVKLTQAYLPVHPAFKQTYNRALLYLSTNTTLADILEQHIFFNTSYKLENTTSKKPVASNSNKKNILKGWFTDESDLSMAAGVTAKDKRAKDAKNQITAIPQSKKKRYTTSEATGVSDVIGGRVIKCDTYPDQALPLNLNLGQLLRLVEAKGITMDWPCIHLTVCQSNKGVDDKLNTELNSALYKQPYSSALQVFSSMGGLALLAQHLPTVYPEAVRPPTNEKVMSEQSDSEWIKVEECDDIYEDIDETVGSSTSSKSSAVISNIPPHSLTAFGLFLRLPGYAEVLLKDMKKALCLLRLVLGVVDDGEGGDIFLSSVADSLPTLPFEVLRNLYDSTPLSTDDGRLLRRISIHNGVVHLLLACLGIFTHQTQANAEKDGATSKDTKQKDERQLYWAKGTGFGTGSTQQSWNVEQALMKQRSEEEHVTVLLLVLASYINPNGEAEDELSEDVLPSNFHDLLANSSLLPALSSYLRNDSVLDMARHIPLYRSALQLLRALAVSSQLVSLLLPQKSRAGEPSISLLLKNMKICVDTYTSKLRINTKGNVKFKSKVVEQLEELEQGEGLATLMPDIQDTANLVSRVTSNLASDQESEGESNMEACLVTSVDEKYLKIMKNMQFGSFEMITETSDGSFKFVISHHFENNAKLTSEQSHPTRVKRIAQEAVTLSTSLPLSYSSSVFVRYDTSRLDVMKVLITGPSDTPYANGCFELDVFFPPDYPLSPMMINLETTGHHSVRFNPNLYNDGKVCLSVLNTWHGRPEEKWNAQTSSFLQVLVSIQSLILVPEPYFNEPGYERSRGTPTGTQSSKEYNNNICQATVRWAMLEQILNPCPCFKDVIYTHFYLKRYEIITQVEGWIKDQENDLTEKKTSKTINKRSSSTGIDSFKKVFQQLKEHLLKLKPPEGVEDDESPKTPTNNVDMSLESSTINGYSAQGDGHGENPELDTDVEMEKMVNDMCE